MCKATPKMLRDGNWGALVTGTANVGDQVEVTTRGGKTWTTTIARIVWTDGQVMIVATANRPAPASAPAAGYQPQKRGHECRCGACDDLLSFGYRPGQRITCKVCGGWAEAY